MSIRHPGEAAHSHGRLRQPRCAGGGCARPDPGSELASLVALWPEELADKSRLGHERRLALLRRALRAERQRGLAGHWTYDLARHERLWRVYRSEIAEFRVRHGIWPPGHGAADRRSG